MTKDPKKTATPEQGFGAVVVILVVCVAAALGAHLWLHRYVNVNWDEWNFLSKVHTFARGEPLARLQTFHVHLFAPLLVDDASGDRELREVFRLRLVSWVSLSVVTVCLVHLGRRLLGSVVAGLYAAWSMLTFSFVVEHGTAARYDPLILGMFFVVAVIVVELQRLTSLRWTVAWAAVAGVVVALGLMISVKMAVYLPTLVVVWAVAALSASGRARRAIVLAAVVWGLVALGVWRALLSWHADDVRGVVGTPAVAAQLSTIGDMVFGGIGLAGPKFRYLHRSLGDDIVFWVFAACGGMVAALALAGRGPLGRSLPRHQLILAVAGALPLLSLVVYRNTYPYYFVTIIPPASLLIGMVVVVIEGAWRGPRWAHLLVMAIVLIPGVISSARILVRAGNDGTTVQRSLLAGVHEVFPTPVPYVDRCGMIASYPRVGPFMSSMTMEVYRRRGEPVWPSVLAATSPQFLIANVSSLELGDLGDDRPQYRWLPDDRRLLQESFIPYWGPLWVAGRTVSLGLEPLDFRIHIAGRYVVEAPSSVVVDGVERTPGEIVTLSAGLHRASAAAPMTVTWRIASAGPPPRRDAPGQLFDGFTRRLDGAPQRRRRAAPGGDDADDKTRPLAAPAE
jgi:hypothetical protein